MLYYNFRVTHHALRMPYVEHASQYMPSPLFWWQRVNPSATSNVEKVRSFYHDYEYGEYQRQTSSLRAFAPEVVHKLSDMAGDVFMPEPMSLPYAAIPLLGLPMALKRSRVARTAFSICLLFIVIHLSSTPWRRQHYFAPMAPMCALVLMISLRELSRWRLRRIPIGTWLCVATLMLCATATGQAIRSELTHPAPPGLARAQLVGELEQLPGDHLMLVRYRGNINPLYEWVYNSTDIDSQRVIVAHSLGEQRDRALRQHYASRRSWLLEVTDNRASLRRYEP
jgi:hypothetical protein